MTVPNILSIFRIVLIPAYAWVYFSDLEHAPLIAGIILAVSGITDLLDGYIARHFNQISELGKILDPLADKLTQVAVMVCLLVKFPVLWPLFVFIVFKELLILSVGYVILKKGFVVTSKWYGKVTTFALYCAFAAFTLFPSLEGEVMLIIATVLIAMLSIALFGYGKLALDIFAKASLSGGDFVGIAEEAYSNKKVKKGI